MTAGRPNVERRASTADYCECGAGIRLNPSYPGGLSEAEQDLFDEWQALHTGPGHSSVTAGEARNVRWSGRGR